MKKAILTYFNYQVDSRLFRLQSKVIQKFNIFDDIDFKPVFYNAPDGEVFPDNVIDVQLNRLFYKEGYDSILILDVDCIPLSSEAISTTFDYIEQNKLVGNAQRSHHLENDEHIFCGASCLGISKFLYNVIGNPSSSPNKRSDICEEFTWLSEERGFHVHMYTPSSYEQLPYNEDSPWQLKEGLEPYGIGTTFNDGDKPFFFHLFQSRLGVYNSIFYNKCNEILR